MKNFLIPSRRDEFKVGIAGASTLAGSKPPTCLSKVARMQ